MIVQSKHKMGIQHDFIWQIRILLILLAMALTPTHAWAHEIRPSIIDLSLSQKGEFELLLNLNLEALIAGIGSDHDDTENAPQADHYNRLRALDSEALNAELQAFLPELRRDIHLSTDDQRLALTFDRADIPQAGDLDLARESVIAFNGNLPAGTETLNWAWPERWGGNVLRVMSTDGDDVYSAYLQDGQSAQGIDIIDVVSQHRGIFSIGVIIGLIATTSLIILSLGIWFRRRT